jgi:hypothetical protein
MQTANVWVLYGSRGSMLLHSLYKSLCLFVNFSGNKGDCTPASSVLGVFRTRQAALVVKEELNQKVTILPIILLDTIITLVII